MRRGFPGCGSPRRGLDHLGCVLRDDRREHGFCRLTGLRWFAWFLRPQPVRSVARDTTAAPPRSGRWVLALGLPARMQRVRWSMWKRRMRRAQAPPCGNAGQDKADPEHTATISALPKRSLVFESISYRLPPFFWGLRAPAPPLWTPRWSGWRRSAIVTILLQSIIRDTFYEL